MMKKSYLSYVPYLSYVITAEKEVQFLISLVLFELLSLPQWDILITLFGSLCWDLVVCTTGLLAKLACPGVRFTKDPKTLRA